MRTRPVTAKRRPASPAEALVILERAERAAGLATAGPEAHAGDHASSDATSASDVGIADWRTRRAGPPRRGYAWIPTPDAMGVRAAMPA